jgi:3-methyladenine DNA glycosylase Tag
MSIEALKHALETLEEVQMAITTTPWMNRRIEELRAAILQVERQEPMAWFTEDHREDKSATTYSKKMSERWKEKGWPVTPLYTAPPQREWQGLTDEERKNCLFADPIFGMAVETFTRAIEAKLKAKNA